MGLKNVALFDLDGSLAGYVEQLLADLETLRAPGETPITALNIWNIDSLPHIKARMNLIKSTPGWWRNLPQISNGMRVFNEAKRIGFHNCVLTKAPSQQPLAWTEKVEWCWSNLGPDTDAQVVSGSKGLTYGKLLYDDFPEFIEQWLEHRPRGLAIMPVNITNEKFFHPQVVRWTGENWDEVSNALNACYLRPEGDGA